MLLSHCGDERGEVIDRSNRVATDDRGDLLNVGAVDLLEGALGGCGGGDAHVGSDHLIHTEACTESRDQL